MSGIGHNSSQASNWIAVSREMRDHPIVGMGNPVKPEDPSRGSFSKYEAWQDLLMEAKWKPFEVSNKGKVVVLQRGQLMAARAWLARRWNWSEKTVRVFIAKLESEFMIRSDKGQSKGQRSGHYANVLTICNYDIYQTLTELDEITKGQSNGQSRASQGPVQGQSGANQGPQNNKETRKQEKIPPSPSQQEAKPVVAAEEISGLNGATVLMVETIAGWIRPLNPDRRTAREWLGNTVQMYGSQVTKDGFADMQAKYANGDIIARPLPLMTKLCQARAKTEKQQPPLQTNYAKNGAYVGKLL